MKTMFKYISTLVVLLLMYGCSELETQKVWRAPTYSENINQFLINPKNKSLIIIGKKYHYIFNENSVSLDILAWSGRKNLHANFYDFEVNSENIISGTYSLQFNNKEASIEEINWLKGNGFKIDKYGVYYKRINVRGTRYLAGDIKIENSSHLNEHYTIYIKRPHSTFETMSKIVLTPISVSGDAIFILGGSTLLIAFAIPNFVFEVLK